MKNFKELVHQHIGIELSNSQLIQFQLLADTLLEANKTTNLTAIRDADSVYLKHFLDSLTLLRAIPQDTHTLADIGSGAGFPGLPIAIARPDIKVTMIESIGKKVDFINHAIKKLALQNAFTENTRAEALAKEVKHLHRYDVVTARAVAFLPVLAEYCLPLVRKGGLFIAMKNDNQAEINEAQQALEAYGGVLETAIPILIPTLTPRQLVVIKKR